MTSVDVTHCAATASFSLHKKCVCTRQTLKCTFLTTHRVNKTKNRKPSGDNCSDYELGIGVYGGDRHL